MSERTCWALRVGRGVFCGGLFGEIMGGSPSKGVCNWDIAHRLHRRIKRESLLKLTVFLGLAHKVVAVGTECSCREGCRGPAATVFFIDFWGETRFSRSLYAPTFAGVLSGVGLNSIWQHRLGGVFIESVSALITRSAGGHAAPVLCASNLASSLALNLAQPVLNKGWNPVRVSVDCAPFARGTSNGTTQQHAP